MTLKEPARLEECCKLRLTENKAKAFSNLAQRNGMTNSEYLRSLATDLIDNQTNVFKAINEHNGRLDKECINTIIKAHRNRDMSLKQHYLLIREVQQQAAGLIDSLTKLSHKLSEPNDQCDQRNQVISQLVNHLLEQA